MKPSAQQIVGALPLSGNSREIAWAKSTTMPANERWYVGYPTFECLARPPTGFGTNSVYNEEFVIGVLCSLGRRMSQTFQKVLIGEDSADHFAIRIPPFADLQRSEHL